MEDIAPRTLGTRCRVDPEPATNYVSRVALLYARRDLILWWTWSFLVTPVCNWRYRPYVVSLCAAARIFPSFGSKEMAPNQLIPSGVVLPMLSGSSLPAKGPGALRLSDKPKTLVDTISRGDIPQSFFGWLNRPREARGIYCYRDANPCRRSQRSLTITV